MPPKMLVYGLLLAIGALSPVITILLAVAIPGEHFSIVDACGTVLVIAGVGWFTLADRWRS